MIKLSRHSASAAVFAFAVGAVAMAAPAAATATLLSVNTGSGWSHDAPGPLFDFNGMGPGWTGTAVIAVRNDSGDNSELALRSSHIADRENGCNRPELLAETGCARDDIGELGHEMVFTVYGGNLSSPLWQGNLYALEAGVTIDARMAAHQVDSLRIESQLPAATGNETQTDSLSFDLQLRLSGPGFSSSTSVEGVKISRARHGLVQELSDVLPFTGTPALRLVAAALALVLLGAMTWLGGLQWRVTRPQ